MDWGGVQGETRRFVLGKFEKRRRQQGYSGKFLKFLSANVTR